MRIVFMGTPSFAASVLTELMEQHDVVAVYTRPDAVRGRGNKLESSPVKALAEARGIEVRTPKTLRDAQEQAYLRGLNPDAICVAAYGMILPQEVLDIPAYGCLNVHASLLPKYRGAAPVERAILAGDEQAGVCIMRMEAGLDTGAYCISRSCDIADMSAERLTEELADKGARALLSALYELEAGQLRWTEQDESEASYAPKIEKGELNLDPQQPVSTNARRVQASGEAHPSKCAIAGRQVTVLEAKCAASDELFGGIEPGQVRFASKRLALGCLDGPLELIQVKPNGKNAMAAAAFASGIQNIKSNSITWERI